MFCDLVNIDFEFFLFEKELYPSKKNLKLNKEFEYIYFFSSDPNSTLCPHRNYPSDYLNYLVSLGIQLPKLDCSGPKRNWWGNYDNLDLAKFLNSKITSTNIATDHGLNPTGIKIINSLEEIPIHLDQFDSQKWIIRSPFGMAGTGSIIFNKEEFRSNISFITKQLEKHPVILAPYFERLMDLGFIFENENYNITWNLNSKTGQFKGGIVFENNDGFANLLKENFKVNLRDILETERKISKIYDQLGNKGIIQIDSFFYKENNSIKFYPLVEVNARKSMGYFINKLKRFLPKNGVGLFLSLNTSKLKKVQNFQERRDSLGDLLFSIDDKTGVIPLSPIEGFLNSFFISGKSLQEIENLKNNFWDKVSISGEFLSSTFNFLKIE
jgi:hypothetical protein